MTDLLRHSQRWFARRRGSALILTMLILLVLSGLGMVALRSVTRSVQQSGAYRVRMQADGLSEAAVEYSSTLAGGDAAAFWGMMNSAQENEAKTLSGMDKRSALEERGAFLKMTQKPGDSSTKVADFEELSTTTDESGLLGANSFEVREQGSEFSVVFRDPMDGPPAPGYGENYCFKKVTIASRGLVGEADRSWQGSGMIAEKRNGLEVFIGPIDCGSR